MTDHLDEPLSDIAHEQASTIAEPESEMGAALSQREPATRPDPYRAYRSFGEPTAVWPYRDAKGSLLGYIRRFDPPGERKQFLPLTPVEENGETIWKSKAFDTPRPLFGSNRLAERPDAPVLVVEGEKAAVGLDGTGGAAALVPSHVAITSPGGSSAAATADWSPVCGCDVVIWPDADKAGAGYAKDVAALARKAGARSVRTVDTSGLPESFDLGDPLPEGLNVEARLHAAQAPLSYISVDGYTMTDQGLWTEMGKGDERKAVRVSDPFEVLSRVRDTVGGGWAKFLRWRDPDGRVHEHAVSEAALHGDLSALAGELASDGLSISREYRSQLAFYLNRVDVDARITRVTRSGWHDIQNTRCFVLPDEVFGGPPTETVILEGTNKGLYERRGSLEEWSDGVGALVAGHARGVLAVSTAFAGPLLGLLNCEGGGIHIYGASSTGKTTLLRAAASVWGRGGSDPGYILSWRATVNAQEGAAALNCDTLLAQDEIGVAEAKDAAAAIYQYTAGVERGRSTRTGGLRPARASDGKLESRYCGWGLA